MRVQRVLLTTLLFVLTGAIAGAVIAFTSLAPLWLGMTPIKGALTNSWIVLPVLVLGALCGAVLMPVFGWIVLGRAGFWRAVLEPTAVAIVCAIAASFVFRSLQTDVLIAGAFVGALSATARLRFSAKPEKLRSDV